MNQQSSKSSTTNGGRSKNGSSLIELPLALWFIFVMLLMPMLSMATMTLRSALMNSVVQNAGQAAAKAKTFEASSPTKPSALNVADQVVRGSVAQFPGLSVEGVDCDILVTPVPAGLVNRFNGKLPTPADSSRNLYQVETKVRGQIQPLFLISPQLFGNVPGVTAPLVVSYVSRAMAENPQGLNK